MSHDHGSGRVSDSPRRGGDDVHPGHSAHDEHAGLAPHGAHHGEHGRDGQHDQTGHDDHAGHGGHGDHSGHGGHDHGDHARQFQRLFWLMLLLAIPTTALSPMFADLLGYSVPDNPATQTVLAVLGTVLYFWGGWPFLSGGADEVRERSPGMMLLIALGITVAYLSSLGATVGALPHD